MRRLLPLKYEGEDGGEDDDDDGVIDLIIVDGCGDETILLTMILGKALSWLIRSSNISMHR